MSNTQQRICAGLNESAAIIHKGNREKGFWDNHRNFGELLMLVTSELGEALEAHRKGRTCVVFDHVTMRLEDSSRHIKVGDKEAYEQHVKGTYEEEIAAAIIRLLDMAAGFGIDIEHHINLKVAYNKSREHMHGKKY